MGRLHRDLGANSQDHFEIVRSDHAVVGVVTDGCGSRPHSEVGAYIGARALANMLCRRLSEGKVSDPLTELPEILEQARIDLLFTLGGIAEKLGPNPFREATDAFLFTIVGMAFTESYVAVFSLGDGFVFVNGERLDLGMEDNKPPYLGYGLIPERVTMAPELFRFRVHRILDITQVDSILAASDGLGDLLEARDANLPGRTEVVGDVSRFWTNDAFFNNPDAVSRRLRLINREHKRASVHTASLEAARDRGETIQPYIKTEKGLLHDDTTLIVARKRP